MVRSGKIAGRIFSLSPFPSTFSLPLFTSLPVRRMVPYYTFSLRPSSTGAVTFAKITPTIIALPTRGPGAQLMCALVLHIHRGRLHHHRHTRTPSTRRDMSCALTRVIRFVTDCDVVAGEEPGRGRSDGRGRRCCAGTTEPDGIPLPFRTKFLRAISEAGSKNFLPPSTCAYTFGFVIREPREYPYIFT